jgi:hypothetical protein
VAYVRRGSKDDTAALHPRHDKPKLPASAAVNSTLEALANSVRLERQLVADAPHGFGWCGCLFRDPG